MSNNTVEQLFQLQENGMRHRGTPGAPREASLPHRDLIISGFELEAPCEHLGRVGRRIIIMVPVAVAICSACTSFFMHVALLFRLAGNSTLKRLTTIASNLEGGPQRDLPGLPHIHMERSVLAILNDRDKRPTRCDTHTTSGPQEQSGSRRHHLPQGMVRSLDVHAEEPGNTRGEVLLCLVAATRCASLTAIRASGPTFKPPHLAPATAPTPSLQQTLDMWICVPHKRHLRRP